MYIGDMNASSIAEHAWTSHHGVNWEAKVLNVSDRWHVICLLECWLMMNHTDEIYHSLIYLRLMTNWILFNLDFVFNFNLSILFINNYYIYIICIIIYIYIWLYWYYFLTLIYNICYYRYHYCVYFSHSTMFVFRLQYPLSFLFIYYPLSSSTCIYIKSYSLFHCYVLMKTPIC